MVTDTPGRTPPEESVTFPLIDPVVALTCAKAGAAAMATNRPKANATILFIAPPNQTVKCKTKIPTPARGPTYHSLSRRSAAKADPSLRILGLWDECRKDELRVEHPGFWMEKLY
jgi:hypothetical protein